MIKGFFITGTDTNIGKTVVSAILVNKFQGIYWKPIQCGTDSFGKKDSEIIEKLCDQKQIIEEFFFLKKPLSPNIASNIENIKIKINDFKGFQKFKYKNTIIIEGAGGLNVPINNSQLMVDLMKFIDLPVILVSRTKLGTINHTLMSLEIIKKKKINLKGIIFVGNDEPNTIRTIKEFGKIIFKREVDILGRVPIVKNLNKKKIKEFEKLIEFNKR